MDTYQELISKANALLEQAEAAKKKEAAAAVGEIIAKMKQFGLSLLDLKAAGAEPGKPPSRATPSAPKYRGPDGTTWAGGRGRKPDWALKAIAEEGEAGLEKYRIKK